MAALCGVVEPFARFCKAVPSANKLQEISGMHSRAGLRGTALGAASYHSVDAETTPEGYCATQAYGCGGWRWSRRRYRRKVQPPKPRRGAAGAALSKRDDDAAAGPIA